jgi:hypothetical protein
MSLTIEFYSVEPQELVTLFSTLLSIQSSENANGEEDLLCEKLDHYPKAEFPGRLLIPDDLDRLCEMFKRHRPLIPSHFQDWCSGELWNDGLGSESLTLIADQFVRELATLNEDEIQHVALSWAVTFPLQEPLHQSLPYKAVVQLQNVARDATVSLKSLIFYLGGSPGFFEYLRNV